MRCVNPVIQAISLLDEKNAEAERAIEQLREEKAALQSALEKDNDSRVQVNY